MTIRQITKEQFSSGTTIDGSRIEKALDDLYNRYNDPMFQDIDGWVENKWCWGFTPKIRESGGTGYVNGALTDGFYQGPFVFIFRSQMPAPFLEGVEPNNKFRFKGVGILDETGAPRTFSAVQDISWFWTSTQVFTKPAILQDFTVFGLFDDYTTGTGDATDRYFANAWKGTVEEEEEYDNKFHVWVIVDNPLNTGDTFIRNSEVHVWGTSAEGLLMNPSTVITTPNQDLAFDYFNGDMAINGNAIRLTDLNIPVFAGARVRFVLGLPGLEANQDGEGIIPGNFTAPYDNETDAYDTTIEKRPTWANNIWSMNVSVLEPLERVDNDPDR